jgi:IS1 family transposase
VEPAELRGLGPEFGDSWCWLAIDADSKLILSHAVGKRDEETCQRFLSRLNEATTGRMQVTSDGLGLYTYNVPLALGSRIDFAQLVKSYSSTQEETRYSPATIMKSEKIARFGMPEMDRVSTSYAERLNLSVRMHCRRFTRLTNAHSKSAAHHEAMINIFVAWYNFARRNEALKKQTPAMASGLAGHVWSIEDLLRNAANC